MSNPIDHNKLYLAVQDQLSQRRSELRALEESLKQGKNTLAEIDECKGWIEVLKKELKSLKEGGHTVFLSNKGSISPKSKVGAKGQVIGRRLEEIRQAIHLHEELLASEGGDASSKGKILQKIDLLLEAKDELLTERKALKQFNHTRFLEMRRAIEDCLNEEDRLALKKKDRKLQQVMREARLLKPSSSNRQSIREKDAATQRVSQEDSESGAQKMKPNSTNSDFEAPPIL